MPRHHPYPTDLQRDPEVHYLSARRLILGTSSVREGGKTQLEDPAQLIGDLCSLSGILPNRRLFSQPRGMEVLER